MRYAAALAAMLAAIAAAAALSTGGGGGGGLTCAGADVTTATFASRVSGAAAGDVLCLSQTAYYGKWAGANKSSPGITITTKPGAGVVPKMLFDFSTGANWITIDNVYIGTGSIGDNRSSIDWGASHITLKNSTVAAYTTIETSTVNMSTTIGPGNTFTYAEDPTGSFVPSHFEGRLSINGGPGDTDGQTAAGLLITGNTFTGNCADGIQANTGGFTVTGNTFKDLIQANCDPHVDSIQFYAGPNGAYYNFVATSNIFINNATGLADYDSSAHNATISNNGFYAVPSSDNGFFNPCAAICIKGSVGETVTHNTIIEAAGGDGVNNHLQIGSNNQGGGSTGAIVRDNVIPEPVATNGSFSFTQDHNWCATGTCPGTGSLNGSPTPTYAGGSTFTTLADFQVASGSRGKGAASDGTDIGVNP